MLRGDSSVWPARFFGLAKEYANKPRGGAAVYAESDIYVESSVPVVKSRTVSDSLRECGASHVSSSQKIPCRPQVWGHFQRLPSYPARIRLHSRNCTRTGARLSGGYAHGRVQAVHILRHAMGRDS